MARCGAAPRAAAPPLLLLLAWHVRPGGCGNDNVLQRLWAKAPPRRTETPAPLASPVLDADAGAGPAGAAGTASHGAVGSDAGTSAGPPGGSAWGGGRVGAGAGAGAAGAAGAAGGAAAATGWVPNVLKRGRPKGSKNKKPRAKRPPRESTASMLLSASRGRLPGSRGPQPGAGCARWSVELKAYALALYDLRKSLAATVTGFSTTDACRFTRATVVTTSPRAHLPPPQAEQQQRQRQSAGPARRAADTSLSFQAL
jgi:hypothetical protein